MHRAVDSWGSRRPLQGWGSSSPRACGLRPGTGRRLACACQERAEWGKGAGDNRCRESARPLGLRGLPQPLPRTGTRLVRLSLPLSSDCCTQGKGGRTASAGQEGPLGSRSEEGQSRSSPPWGGTWRPQTGAGRMAQQEPGSTWHRTQPGEEEQGARALKARHQGIAEGQCGRHLCSVRTSYESQEWGGGGPLVEGRGTAGEGGREPAIQEASLPVPAVGLEISAPAPDSLPARSVRLAGPCPPCALGSKLLVHAWTQP